MSDFLFNAIVLGGIGWLAIVLISLSDEVSKNIIDWKDKAKITDSLGSIFLMLSIPIIILCFIAFSAFLIISVIVYDVPILSTTEKVISTEYKKVEDVNEHNDLFGLVPYCKVTYVEGDEDYSVSVNGLYANQKNIAIKQKSITHQFLGRNIITFNRKVNEFE